MIFMENITIILQEKDINIKITWTNGNSEMYKIQNLNETIEIKQKEK